MPWRYLAGGSPVDVSARRRVEGAAPTRRWAQLITSFLSRLVICFVRLTHWDGLLVCMLDPRITAVTSRAWKSVPVVGRFLENYGVLWTDEDVVGRATRYVTDGGVCWLAPCGFAPSGGCPHPHSGAAQIARASGVPIVYVTLQDDVRRRALRRSRLTILIGEPRLADTDAPVDVVTARLVAALHAQQPSQVSSPAGQAAVVGACPGRPRRRAAPSRR